MLDNIPGVYDSDELEQRSAVLTEKAQAVAEELRVRVPDTEKARRLPVENMERICDEGLLTVCLLYTSPSPRDGLLSRMPSSA